MLLIAGHQEGVGAGSGNGDRAVAADGQAIVNNLRSLRIAQRSCQRGDAGLSWAEGRVNGSIGVEPVQAAAGEDHDLTAGFHVDGFDDGAAPFRLAIVLWLIWEMPLVPTAGSMPSELTAMTLLLASMALAETVKLPA